MKKTMEMLLNVTDKNFETAKANVKLNVERNVAGWKMDSEAVKSFSSLDKRDERLVEALVQSVLYNSKGNMIRKLPARVIKGEEFEEREKNVIVNIPTFVLVEDEKNGHLIRQDVQMGMCRAFSFFNIVIEEESETYMSCHLETEDGTVHPLIQIKVSHKGENPCYEKMGSYVMNGVSNYEYLLSSAAQTRTDSAWFINKTVGAENFLDKITCGDFKTKVSAKETAVIPKYAKYLGLSFTTATKVSLNREVKVGYISSIGTADKEFADGCFICRHSFMREIMREYKGGKFFEKSKDGMAIQVRIGWCVKGMMMTIPDKLFESRFGDAEVVLTGSTLKVGKTIPSELTKEGIVWIANTFEPATSDKRLSFMFTMNMLNMSCKAEEVIKRHIGYEFSDMESCFDSSEAVASYFKEGYEDISVANSLNALIQVNPDALKDELIFNSLKYQFSHRIEDLKAGKLRGVWNQVFLPDPSVFFMGTFENGKISYSEEQVKELVLQNKEVVSKVRGDEVIVMRSPSNLAGQIVRATNRRSSLSETIKINCITVNTNQLYYLNSRCCEAIFFSESNNDMLLELAGADVDGDTAKLAILTPSKDLIEEFNGNEELIDRYVGPWRHLYKEVSPFVAIGDTKAVINKVPLSYKAIKENKLGSLVSDNTGVITNNMFCIADLIASLLRVSDEELFSHKTQTGWSGLLTKDVLFVLSRMAYNTNKAISSDLGYYEEMFDDEIVTQIKDLNKYWDFLTSSKVGNKTLNDLMFKGEIPILKAAFLKNASMKKGFKIQTLRFLNNCLKIFGHLQMIQIDAAKTNRYPNLDKFNFARLRQQKIENGQKTIISIRPYWFGAVKDILSDRKTKGYFKSYSVQGMIYDISSTMEKVLMSKQPEANVPLFMNEASNVTLKGCMSRFFDNLYQASSLMKDYQRLYIEGSKDEIKNKKRALDGFLKKSLKLKALPIIKSFDLEDILKSAYACSKASMKLEGSRVRFSAFLTYFGEEAITYFASKNRGSRMYRASLTEDFATGMYDGEYSVKVANGKIYMQDVVEIGTTKAVDGNATLKYLNGNYWVSVEVSNNEVFADVVVATSNISKVNGKTVTLRKGNASFKGHMVSVMDIYVGKTKVGFIANQDFNKVMSLNESSVTVKIIDADEKKSVHHAKITW